MTDPTPAIWKVAIPARPIDDQHRARIRQNLRLIRLQLAREEPDLGEIMAACNRIEEIVD
jgi:hypothetical protein